MLKIENIVTPSPEQWQAIIMGARNPMNSWDKSDSVYCDDFGCSCCQYVDDCGNATFLNLEDGYAVGEKDLDLLSRLSKAGTDHAKYLRMIPVYLDITGPMYWWKEFDTYKIGTVRNSCSTMHKIQAKEFTREDFSIEHLDFRDSLNCFDNIIHLLNAYRDLYITTKDKYNWWQMIQLLPSSYNQKSTVMLNYQVLKNIYHSRKNHKLDEWHTFCETIESLPHSRLITEV